MKLELPDARISVNSHKRLSLLKSCFLGSTCAASLDELYEANSEAVAVAVVVSTTLAAAAGESLSGSLRRTHFLPL